MTQVWHLQVIWGIMISLGCAVFLTVLSATVANRWFEKRRGIVLGLLMASSAAGQMVLFPVLSYLVITYSWRMALSVFIVLGVLMIPVIAIWMRDRPADKGLVPYGAGHCEPMPLDANRKDPVAAAFEGLWIGVRSAPFWLLASSFFICGLRLPV